MVAVVAGSGSGLANSSREVIGSAGELGNAATGRAGEQVTVNAADGSLIVQDRDEYLVGVGPDIDLLRTYNRNGIADGDNNDHWRIGYYRTIKTDGGVIRRIEADGSQSTYVNNGGRYVSTNGAGQYDSLSFDSTYWTWTDGDSGVKEVYEAAGASTYRLIRVEDPEGNAVKVGYTGELITTLSTYKAGASSTSETVTLHYSGTALQKITTAYVDAQGAAKTRSVTSYGYVGGRLDIVTTDLSPQDSSTSDGAKYTVRYGYDASGRLNSIQQTDGTLVSIEYYEPPHAHAGRVKSVLDGRGLGTTFTYNTGDRTTTVTDARGQATTLKYGASGELQEVSGAVTGGSSFVQKYTYSPNGDLLTSTNAKNETTTYQYDSATGALIRRTDHFGNVVERSYTTEGLLASETSYVNPDLDGVAGSGTASAPRTTNYFYDNSGSSAVKRRLAYVLGPQGEVTRYSYNALGQVERRVEYTGALFTAGSPSFTSLETWVNGSQAPSVERQVIDYAYNLRGQVEAEKRYATVSVNSGAIVLGGLSTATYTYDPSGRLLTSLDASGVKLTYEYDGLGRVTKTLDTNNVATIYSYDDAGRKTSIALTNGQTTVQTFNKWGDLISSDVLGAGNTPTNLKKLGETQYSYDDLGRLWRATDATGVKTFVLYDVSGRKSADIAANGQLTEYLYDAAGRLIQQIAYITPLSQAKLDALTATSKVSDAGIRPVIAYGEDRITTYYYDTAGRLTGVQDADGYLTHTKYDGTGAVTSQTTYFTATTVTRLDAALGTTRSTAPTQPTVTTDAAKDRTIRNLYDAAGRLAARIDGDGGLTRWTYDASGNQRSQLRRSALLTDSERTTGTLTTLSALAVLADDEFTQWLYDGHGRRIAQLNGEGHLTEYTYDAAGRLKDTLQYLKQAFKPITVGSPNTQRWLLRSELAGFATSLGTALKTTRTYNNLGLLERETGTDSSITEHKYDNLQRLERTTLAKGTAEERVRLVGYDDWGRANSTSTQGDARAVATTYDSAGRLASVTDARGHKTVYYYDTQGRQIYAILIDPNVEGKVRGEVRETIYSSFSEVSATVTHAERLLKEDGFDLLALAGGLTTETLDAKVAALSSSSLDNRVSQTYNRRGLIQQAVDALGQKTDYTYNAFGRVSREVRDIDPAGTASPRSLTTDHSYNRRGDLTWTQHSGPSLASNVVTSSIFDALGRLNKSTIDKSVGVSVTTTYEYIRDNSTGRVVKIIGPAAETSTAYDAVDRVLAHKNRLGHVVGYKHDDVNRKLTLTTSEGFKTETEYTRHGQTYKITQMETAATTTYSYDTHGNLLTVTDPLGNVTKNSYDANDNLVQVIKGLTAYDGSAPINDGSATATSYSFDAANRVLTQTVDPDGLQLRTSYAYDGQSRKLKITDPRGTVTTQVFNAKGELKDVIVDDVDGGLRLKTSYSYDAQSRVLSVTEGAGTTAARKTEYAYDILGRRVSETVDPQGLQLKTSYEYDKAGRLLLKRDALNQITARYRYDNADRLLYSVDALGAVTRYYYDGESRLTSTLAYATPLAGWASLTEVDLGTALGAIGSTAADALSVNAYDRDGRLIYTVNALGEVTRHQRDAAGRVVMQRQYAQAISDVTVSMSTGTIDAKLGLVKDDAKDHITRYAYDKAGNLRFTINAEGYVSEQRYDAAGRVVVSIEHEKPTPLGSLPSETELAGRYTPMRWTFDNAMQGFTGAAGGIENGRLKLVSKPASGGWADVNGARTLPVGSTLKLDIQPMQYQQDLHVILRDASWQPGRIAVILKPNGKIESQRQTASNTYIGAVIGNYEAGKTYTIEIESFDKGAWIYIYPKGSSRDAADCIKSRVEEPTLTWQGVRTQLAVHRAAHLPGETISYVDNLEEIPATQGGRATQFAYDAAGRPRFKVDAEGYVTETRYDSVTARTTTLRYASRISGVSNYTPANYAPKLASFTAGVLAGLGTSTSVSRELDRAGRLSLETDGNGVQTHYGYDTAGRLETETRAFNVAGQASTTRYRYNSAGLHSEVIRGDGTAQASTTRYGYDTLGRLSKTIAPRGVALAEGMGEWEKAERVRLGYAEDLSTLPTDVRAIVRDVLLARYTTETEYDPAGRVKTATRRVSAATDGLGTPQATLTTTTEYDSFGNVIKVTDPRGYSRHQVFDKLGRVVQEVDAEKYLTVHTYDAFDNRLSSLRLDARVLGTVTAGQAVAVAATPPGSGAYVLSNAALDHLTSREYDRNNRLLRETDAENYIEGAVGALNAFGERASVSNKLGASVSYTYDRLGRILSETLPVQVRDGNGVLKDVVNEYQYDSHGNRIISIEAKGLPEQRTTQMRYDGANRLTARIGMAYSALNADNTTSTVTPADSYRYDGRGNLIEQISHGQLQANGSITGGKRSVTYYDALDRQAVQISADRVVTQSTYDQAGNLAKQTTYANRLADGVVINPTGTAPAATVDAANDRCYVHRYDELGRKIETMLDGLHAWDSGLTGTGLVISGLTAQRTSLQTFFYDAAGNVTEVKNGRGYSSYSYHDGLGRRTLSIDAGGAAIAWDYDRSGSMATRETKYSGMLPGGYGRQADTLAGLSTVNNPASLQTVIKGLSSHVVADDRVAAFTLDRLDRVTEKRILGVAQDHIDASGTRTKGMAAATTRYSYNGLSQVTQLSELAANLGASETWEVSDSSYDALGRETQRKGVAFTDWEGDTVRSTADVEYNGLGEVARRIQRGKNADALVETDDRITRYAYDANGVLTSSTDASGAVTQYDYDANGDLVRRTSKDVVRSDSTADVPKLRDIIKRYMLDAAGRMASETTSESYKPTNAETRKTRYNAFGEVSAKGIGDGYEEFFEYSTLGKISKTNTGDGAIKFYVYDAAGNQTREIKGNGDDTVDMKAMTLEQATISSKLYSRVSIYDKRNLVTQTIDPKIDFLKNTGSLNKLYQERWQPAWAASAMQTVSGAFIASGNPIALSGNPPQIYISNPFGYTTSMFSGRFFDTEAEAKATQVGPDWGADARHGYYWDVSSLKGTTKYFRYAIHDAYDGPTFIGCVGSITVSTSGNVTLNPHPPEHGVIGYYEPYLYLPLPDIPSWSTTYVSYTLRDDTGGIYSSGRIGGNSQDPGRIQLYRDTPSGFVSLRPSSGTLKFNLVYERSGWPTPARMVGYVSSDGTVVLSEPKTDPLSQPVSFYVKGRNNPYAALWINGNAHYIVGTYVARGQDPSDPNNHYTKFTFDAKDVASNGTTLDFNLQLLNNSWTQAHDEAGKALWQNGRVYFDPNYGGLPIVMEKITEIRSVNAVTIKRFQEFNAFGEVSEERDERVGERMLAAINDDRQQKNQATLGSLTPEQQLAALTTLKYNTLGQLVSKLDPETFITLENGYRYRARPETNYGYDLLGRLTTLTDANGNLSRVQYLAGVRGSQARVQREFDAAGGHADILNVTGAGIRLSEYDVFGDARRLTEALGSDDERVTERAYDARGLLQTVVRKGVQRLLNGNGETLDTARDLQDTYSYDQLGQRLSATNALSIKTRTDYDALGRVVQTVSGNGFVTSYSYALRVAGQADGITSLPGTSSGGYVLTTLRADGRSLKDKIDYFGHTTWHKDLGGTEFTYSYNSAAQLSQQTSTRRGVGQHIEYTYYANGYISGFKDHYLLLRSQYAYDNAGNRVYEGTFGPDATGQDSSWQSATIVYDELNRISRVHDDNYFDVRYEFDANGNRRRIHSVYTDGLAGLRATQDYWYAYDNLNRFTISKGRLETAAGVHTTARGANATDANVVLRRGPEGTLLGYDKLSQRRSATYTYKSGTTEQTINETYGYSQDGYLQTTKQGAQLVATRKLDDIGRTRLLTDLQNKQSTASTYDDDNRLLTQNFIGKLDNLSDTSANYSMGYLYYNKNVDSNGVASDDLTKISGSGAGSLASVTQYPPPGSPFGSATLYSYAYWDDAKQSKITKKGAANQETHTSLSYDINGHIDSTYDNGTGVNRGFVTNANGQVLRRSGSNGTHYFYYADGHRIGDVGNTPDDKSRVSYAEQLARRATAESADQRRDRYTRPSPVTSADFDQNYEPINDSYPGNAAASYIVQRNGQTLRDIAQAMWGDSSLWYLIAESNGMLSDGSLAAGQVLVIPNKVANIHNNSNTWRPYNAGEAIGAVDPNWSSANTGAFRDLAQRIQNSIGAAMGNLSVGNALMAFAEQASAMAPLYMSSFSSRFAAEQRAKDKEAAEKQEAKEKADANRKLLIQLLQAPATQQQAVEAVHAVRQEAIGESFVQTYQSMRAAARGAASGWLSSTSTVFGSSLAEPERPSPYSLIGRFGKNGGRSDLLFSDPGDPYDFAGAQRYFDSVLGDPGVQVADASRDSVRLLQLKRNLRELKTLSLQAKPPVGPRASAGRADPGGARLILEKPEILMAAESLSTTKYLMVDTPIIERMTPVESLRLDPLTIESSVLANLPQPTEGFWFGATGGSRDPFDRTPLSFSEKAGAFTRGLVTSPITSAYGLLSEIGSQYRDVYSMVRSPSTFTPSSELLTSYTHEGFGATLKNMGAGLLKSPSSPIFDLLDGHYERAGNGLSGTLAMGSGLARLGNGARLAGKANYSLRPFSGDELELDFVGPQRPLSRQQLDMLTSHPDAHSIARHGGVVTDPQLMHRSLTGEAPDGYVKPDKKNGGVILPPMSSAFHSDQLLAYADNAVRESGTLAAKISQNPGQLYVTLTPTDVGDLGYNLGRGYARIGGAKFNPTLQGAPNLITNLRSIQATYGFNSLTNRWELVTIFPSR